MNNKERAAATLEWLENLRSKNQLHLSRAECKPHVRESELNSIKRKLYNIDYLIELTKARLEDGGTDNADS